MPEKLGILYALPVEGNFTIVLKIILKELCFFLCCSLSPQLANFIMIFIRSLEWLL